MRHVRTPSRSPVEITWASVVLRAAGFERVEVSAGTGHAGTAVALAARKTDVGTSAWPGSLASAASHLLDGRGFSPIYNTWEPV
ncbi:hypothetical protein [Saccharomonospora iraqiensis]|uniref:hypothetical protein n=1 Tax=Saccharomonospora iraqiensis TaxID=52698 RepID=UPI00022E0435|nr:hypothetical protein [Saccharomonospora iraqiensis]